ncbi:MAG: hypothetical protein HZB61_03050 [Nitrospirae bacterium]|nr:hypothetical protein [Nitrospirota bacterium]
MCHLWALRLLHGAASSTDGNYSGMAVSDVSVTNTDDADTAGVTVTPTSGLTTTEGGGAATFTVVLNSQPTADVTIAMSSSDTTEGNVSPSSLTFTTANWNTPKTVTVAGVNDFIIDGSIAYTIVTAGAASADANYNSMDAPDVSVTNTDNDVAGITVTPTSGLTTTEAGGTATFTIVLNSQPASDVTIGLSSGDTTEGSVSPSSLTFNSANWNTPQTVTVTGVNDDTDDGDIAYTIVTAGAASTDANYNGLDASDVSVTNTDNDVAVITVTPTGGLTTTEAGGAATFTVVLNSAPTADVTIALSSSDTTEGNVSPLSLTFTSANWNTPKTVTVAGVNDFIIDGSIAYTIVTAGAASADANYNSMDAPDVSVTNTDNDVAGITVTPTSGLTTTEAGGTATFTVVLNSQPSSDVTIALNSSDATEGNVSPLSLTFTSANWNSPQTVTVTGTDDFADDGNITYTIVTAAASSLDASYNGINAPDVAVTNSDDDTAAIFVEPASGLTTTEDGGVNMFMIVLESQPAADVTIALSSSNPNEGTVSVANITFTTENWADTQFVIITGVNDFVVDGDVQYTVVTAPATSSDPIYNGMNASDISVINLDND